VASPLAGVSLILLARAGANAATWRGAIGGALRDAAVVDVAAAPLDGLPRRLGREAARAVNAAARDARGDVLVLVDADCAPPPSERLHAWVAHAATSGSGPVGALVQDANGDIAGGAFVLDPARIGAAPWHGEPTGYWGMAGRAALLQNVAAVTIEAMAIPRDLWLSLHGLDVEAFTTRGYDVDFCLRATDAGRRPVWYPGVVLRHAGAISDDVQSASLDVDEADAAAMRARWGVRLAEDPAYNPNLTRAPHLFELALPDAAP
jgi:O-antigen biosynthesis protein